MTAPSTPEEPRRETRTEWRNVYRVGASKEFSFPTLHVTRDRADVAALGIKARRVAVDRVENGQAITREML